MKQNIRNRINKRARTLFIILIILASVVGIRLFYMQVVKYDIYREKLINNIQQETTIKADRGVIYDRNMNVLATNITTYRIFISPADIETDEDAKLISEKLSDILGVEYSTVYEKTQKKNRKDETIKKKATEDEAELVRAFKSENKLSRQVYLEATSTRYYPYGSIASNIIGAMGTDGGLFGIELEYNKELSGIDGKYITVKNAQSENLPFSYDYYIEAIDGNSIVTTIDIALQSMLEAQLKEAYLNANAGNGVAGIVLDVNTGEVLAMAQYPTVDLNAPYELNSVAEEKYNSYIESEEFLSSLTEKGLVVGTEEYDKAYEAAVNEYYWELVYNSWNNKAVSDLYEPGSTFKIITTAMALESKVTSFDDVYNCGGSLTVGGSRIKCHIYPGAHGSQNYASMLQKSCNPALMQVAAKIGGTNFYKYFSLFGYTSKTDIDLPGEATGLYTSLSGFNAVELACYSFGQTFKTSMIQQISAISAVANGGDLIAPRVVSALMDSDGNTVKSFSTEVKRQVTSALVGAEIMDVLEKGVSGNGGAKNAYIAGYKIAAKTGTSEKRDTINPITGQKDLRIGSTVAVAPSDNPMISVLLIVDEPRAGSVYGSAVAAPYIANFLEEALPYLGVEREYSEEETARMTVTVKNYSGYDVESAVSAIKKAGLQYEIVGSGETVSAQMPSGGTKIMKSGGKIILYTGGSSVNGNSVTVPDVVGMTAQNAIKTLQAKGLNVRIEGTSNYAEGEGATVISQKIEVGTSVKYGSVVSITCRYLTDADDAEIEE